MATARDQQRNRRFAIRAAAGALLDGSGEVSGARRGAVGLGAALAAILLTIAAGIGIFGGHSRVFGGNSASAQPAVASSGSAKPTASALLTPSSSPSAPWQRTGVLIVDGTTGARYVYRAGSLRPVRNEASAFLILGTAAPTTVKIAHAALASARAGTPIGIDNAPDAVPPASAIVHGGWVLCSGPVAADGKPASRIVVPAGGTFGSTGFVGYGDDLTGGAGLGDAAIVVSAGGSDYLVWQHHRYQVNDPAGVFKAWKWTDVTPLPVAADVLDALPAGPTISPTALGATKPVRNSLAPTSTLCVTLTTQGHAVHTVVNATVAAGAGAARIVIAAHGGVLVRATAGASTLYLVTDHGIRYQIVNAAALASLGYRSAPTVSVSADVLKLIPDGPALSRFVAINR